MTCYDQVLWWQWEGKNSLLTGRNVWQNQDQGEEAIWRDWPGGGEEGKKATCCGRETEINNKWFSREVY